MFLKTNEGCFSQISLNNMQLIVTYTFHETTFIVSYLQAFPKLVMHNIDIVIVD